jgi:hypothetical protein
MSLISSGLKNIKKETSMKQFAGPSETAVDFKRTRRLYIPEEGTLQNEN